MEAANWLSTGEAALILGITPRTLYRIIDEGAVVAYRFGRVIRLMERDVEAFIAGSRIVPGSLGHLVEGGVDASDEFVAAYEDAATNGAAYKGLIG